MMSQLKICILTMSFISSVKGQVINSELRQRVLRANNVDSLYVFGNWTENGQTETHLKYLGEVPTTDGQILKIVNSVGYWGLSHRATSQILIYNVKNQYVGNYGSLMPSDLPVKLENGWLVFTNVDNLDCDNNLITKIDFTAGIPKQIFIKCKGLSDGKLKGDFYSFSTEE